MIKMHLDDQLTKHHSLSGEGFDIFDLTLVVDQIELVDLSS